MLLNPTLRLRDTKLRMRDEAMRAEDVCFMIDDIEFNFNFLVSGQIRYCLAMNFTTHM